MTCYTIQSLISISFHNNISIDNLILLIDADTLSDPEPSKTPTIGFDAKHIFQFKQQNTLTTEADQTFKATQGCSVASVLLGFCLEIR